jgi:DNA polymerase III delta prime subunit
MSVVSDLPPEIYQFLTQPAPQTILVRGPPGTGKSTLALALLQEFPGARFLISSRVSEAGLRHEYPWLPGGGNIHVIDAASRNLTVVDSARVLGHLGEIIRDPGKSKELRGLWLPPPVQEAWSRADHARPLMVVIDSWDALVERYLGSTPRPEGLPDRAELERLLLDELSSGPIFLVLVLERAEGSQLDYLVNGVLETASNGHSGRPERWLHLRKLRGTRVDNPVYPFTLEGARFQSVGPLQADMLGPIVPPQPEPDRQAGYLWPGSADLASMIGRLPLGHLTLVERDLAVPIDSMVLLTRPLAAHVLRSGGRVLHVLPPNLSPEEMMKAYRPLLSPEQLVRQVRFQLSSVREELPEELSKLVVPGPVTGERGSPPRTPEAIRFLKDAERPGAANLSLVWTTALHAIGGGRDAAINPSTIPDVAASYLSGAPAHSVFLGPHEDPIVVALRPTAAVRISMQSAAGRVFLWGEHPTTPSFVLSESDEAAGRPYRLIRMV